MCDTVARVQASRRLVSRTSERAVKLLSKTVQHRFPLSRAPAPAPGCPTRLRARLSGVVGVRTLPYENLSDELVGGLVDFHWDEDAQAFLDYGKHVGDGAIVEEVLVRCRRGNDRRTGIVSCAETASR